MSVLHTLVNSGLSETVILTVLLMLLVVNELLGGLDIQPIKRIRRMIQYTIIPLILLFILLAVVRMARLV